MTIPSFHQLTKDGQAVVADPSVVSVFERLRQLAQQSADKEALVFVDPRSGLRETLTYQELWQQVRVLAQRLNEAGVQSGTAVGLNLANSPEILLVHCACWLLGAITVPLDLKRDDLDRKQYKLSFTDCAFVIVEADEAATEEAVALRQRLPELAVVPLSQEIREEWVAESKRLAALDSIEPAAVDFDRTCLILFTSGTTQLPKAVPLSLANLFLNADGIRDWLQLTAEDRFYIVLPLHHINSTTMSLATLMAGGTIVLSARYSKSGFWPAMAEYTCTLSSIVPTICFDLLSEQTAFDERSQQLQQVTRIQLGSAPVQPTDVLKFFDQFDIRLVQGYGSTETALRVTGTAWAGASDEAYREGVRLNTIGAELKWNNVTVLRPDGTPAEEKETGEICIRGPILTRGYLKNEAANEEAFVDGWFHSGDVGHWQTVSGQRVFCITGRRKEILIKGGVNLSPLSIEHALLQFSPDISTCYVAAYPDPRYGEEIGAVVAFAETVTPDRRRAVWQELQAAVDTQTIPGLSAYEHPRLLMEVPLTSLPTTSTGKVQRITIKEYFTTLKTPLAETSTHLFRQLTPFDEVHLERLVEIHNTRWGEALGLTAAVARQAVQNGWVIGAFERANGELVGSAFALRVRSSELEPVADWARSYEGMTGGLTLRPHDPQGDALVWVTISTVGKPLAPEITEDDLEYRRWLEQAPAVVESYLATQTDPVLQFHARAKANLTAGATIAAVLPAARPADTAALGYCVLMKYPPLSDTVAVQPEASLGVQLLEAGFVKAAAAGIKTLYAYSRPAGFLAWLQQQ